MAQKKIGVIALSSPADPKRVERGVKNLTRRGFEVVLPVDPSRCYGTTEYLFSAASAETRARGLEQLFADSDTGFILALRGAYGTVEVLEHFDFSIARKNPKPFIGFSDVTAMLVALQQRAGISVVHGPNLDGAFSAEVGDQDRERSVAALLEFLGGASYSSPVHHLFGPTNQVHGPVSGGNLSLLASLAGTTDAPQFSGKILFFEEIGEKPYRVHRMLQQMKRAGMLQGLLGVLIGDMISCVHGAGQGPSWQECVKDVLAPLAIPVRTVTGMGHGALNLPLPFGDPVTLSNSSLEVPSLTAL